MKHLKLYTTILEKIRLLEKVQFLVKKNEKILIPLNMADGSLIWILSRSEAKNQLNMQEYKEKMKGVFSTCISTDTLDESPMAYKNGEEIIKAIEPTAIILDHLKPIYNFKAKEWGLLFMIKLKQQMCRKDWNYVRSRIFSKIWTKRK